MFDLYLPFLAAGGMVGAIIGWVVGNLTPMLWPCDILLYEKRGNGYVVKRDYAKRLKNEQGCNMFKLKNEKRIIRPIGFENIDNTSSKRPLAMLYSPDRDEYYSVCFKDKKLSEAEKQKLITLGMPIELAENFGKGQLEVIPEDMKFWYINEQRASIERWKKGAGIWEKYSGPIMLITAGLLIIVMLVLVMDRMGAITNGLSSVTSELNKLVTQLTSSGIQVHTNEPSGQSIIPGIPAPP